MKQNYVELFAKACLMIIRGELIMIIIILIIMFRCRQSCSLESSRGEVSRDLVTGFLLTMTRSEGVVTNTNKPLQ